jgi:predicted nucleic acid-binding protein
MQRDWLVDTDVMVDFLRGHPKAVSLIGAHADRIVLPGIVVAELYAGVKGPDEMAALDNLISIFRVTPISSEIARAGGIHKRDYSRSHGVGLADALVAATCESMHAELKTLNVKHYPMVKRLAPAYEKP